MSPHLRKSLIVARWEFLATVTRRAYLFAVVAIPLVYGGMTAVGVFVGRVTADRSNRLPILVVDRAHALDLDVASAVESQATGSRDTAPAATAAVPLVESDDLDTAMAELRGRRAAAVFVVDTDYFQTGVVSEYSRDTGFFALPTERARQARLGAAIRASLLKPQMTGEALARAYTPIAEVKRLTLNDQGRSQPANDAAGLGSFGVFYILLMSIFLSAGFLQQATVDDRQNRMLEMLLSSVDADELLIGKLIGLGGAGLLQVSVYLLLIIAPGATFLAFFSVSIPELLLSLVYFAIAYLLFAGLMTGTGMLGRTPQESAQYATLWTFAAASPLFFARAIAAAPNGAVARALSFFPLTGPTTMMLRLTSGDVPRFDIGLSIAIGLLAIVAVLRAASRIFRAASLMYGKRPSLPELMRWIKASA